jgi:hypothetical protein
VIVSRDLRRIGRGWVLAAVITGLIGCGVSTQTTTSTLSITTANRRVKAVIDGPASITSSEPPSEAVTVLFSGRKLVIEKDRVLPVRLCESFRRIC